MKRTDVIDNSNIRVGNVIVGLSSSGMRLMKQSIMEEWEVMDLHLCRHDVFSKILAEKYPESFDSSVPEDLVYSGTKQLTDKIDGISLDTGKLVLSPTRTYAL